MVNYKKEYYFDFEVEESVNKVSILTWTEYPDPDSRPLQCVEFNLPDGSEARVYFDLTQLKQVYNNISMQARLTTDNKELNVSLVQYLNSASFNEIDYNRLGSVTLAVENVLKSEDVDNISLVFGLIDDNHNIVNIYCRNMPCKFLQKIYEVMINEDDQEDLDENKVTDLIFELFE